MSSTNSALGVRDQRTDVVELVAAVLVTRVLRRDDEVDAVGSVADLVLDPLEVDLELFGGVGDGTEHAEAAGLRHGRDHVAAVAEREDRELDAEHVGGGGLHGSLWPARESATKRLWSLVGPEESRTLA